jgi:hypothetical protein
MDDATGGRPRRQPSVSGLHRLGLTLRRHAGAGSPRGCRKVGWSSIMLPSFAGSNAMRLSETGEVGPISKRPMIHTVLMRRITKSRSSGTTWTGPSTRPAPSEPFTSFEKP